MTPITRVLRRVFFRPIGEAMDRERRLRETNIRIDHANRMLGNAIEGFGRSSTELQEANQNVVNGQMLEMIRRLSTTLDNK